MCNICKELVACPIGEKRRILIEDPGRGMVYRGEGKRTSIDAYGKELYIQGPMFIIDKYPGYTECFISTYIWDENGVNYGSGVDNIKFCPFCGEELVKEDTK